LQGYELNIISGLAYGIDVKAHLTALDMGLFTAAVLGCGIDKVYPESNRSVYERMIENGVIISEYAPGIPPLSWHFPVRNRIISGLSDGVLLIEAKEKSGSLITADQALEQGREVFAIPGRISDATSAGCNMLIRQGAECITKAEDIASELMLNSDKSIKKKHLSKIPLAPMEKIVYSCVRLESKHIDDICRESGVSTSEVLSVLFELKRKNLIWEPVRNYFVRNT
jgi:DNA processing protein